METRELDNLIYGKNPLSRIVSIEIENDKAIIFREFEDKVVQQEIPHKFWILGAKQHNSSWVTLNGSQHYKYGKQFSHFADWYSAKKSLKKEDIFCLNNHTEALMLKDGYTYFKNMEITDVSVLSFDIEATNLDHNEDSKVLLISNTFRKNGVITKKLFSYDEYANDGQMILAWSNWVRELDPSVICGHNIFSYDLPYLDFCFSRYFETPIKLGRNHKPLKFNRLFESKYRVDGSRDLHYYRCDCYGRNLIDTMFLAYKYDVATRKYSSYGLKNIIAQEGLEKKDRVFYDANEIRFKYKIPEEWAKIKAYCMDDADDSLALYDLMGPVMFYLCPVIPKSFQEVVSSASGSQINSVMVRSYLQNKHSIPKASESVDYEGAISFAIPGIYKNMYKIDFSQLYPSIMMQYNVYDSAKDPKQHFSYIVKYFADFRQKYKKLYKETGKKQFDYLQQVAKVIANSCYGFLGASGLQYNSPEQAAFITAKGRELLKYTIEWATSKQTEEWIDLFNQKVENA